MPNHDDSLPNSNDGRARPNLRSRRTAASFVRRRIDTPYVQAVISALCEAWMSGEDGPVGAVMSRVGEDIYLVQLPHDLETSLLVDERRGIAIDPAFGLYDDFPGRVDECERYRLQWTGVARTVRGLEVLRATPQSVIAALSIAPGEVCVVRA